MKDKKELAKDLEELQDMISIVVRKLSQINQKLIEERINISNDQIDLEEIFREGGILNNMPEFFSEVKGEIDKISSEFRIFLTSLVIRESQ